jgi:Clathrin light chain
VCVSFVLTLSSLFSLLSSLSLSLVYSKEESERVQDIESTMQNGTEWEKVAKLVNLQASNNESRDIDRQRRLLIQLKNDKENDVFAK